MKSTSYIDHIYRSIDHYIHTHDGRNPNAIYVTPIFIQCTVIKGRFFGSDLIEKGDLGYTIQTYNAFIPLIVSWDIPSNSIAMNPDEYRRWQDDEFEKAVLL